MYTIQFYEVNFANGQTIVMLISKTLYKMFHFETQSQIFCMNKVSE